jgi:hypothetical protein
MTYAADAGTERFLARNGSPPSRGSGRYLRRQPGRDPVVPAAAAAATAATSFASAAATTTAAAASTVATTAAATTTSSATAAPASTAPTEASSATAAAAASSSAEAPTASTSAQPAASPAAPGHRSNVDDGHYRHPDPDDADNWEWANIGDGRIDGRAFRRSEQWAGSGELGRRGKHAGNDRRSGTGDRWERGLRLCGAVLACDC